MLASDLDELERLLADERAAIRRLDGAQVVELAQRKRQIVESLQARRPEITPALAARFQALAPALRHNGILLAHARNVLRDVVTCLAGRSIVQPVSRPSTSAAPPAVRSISVRG